ncbi:MAG: hypothetical protein RRC34_02640 [Lentisphaeria bacterium]|nr:hypothetical protein [Lentisphaeria bacterium]
MRHTILHFLAWCRRVWCSERGDVLAEYAVLLVMIMVPLIGASVGLVNPGGATFTTEGTINGDDFGVFGNAMVAAFRRIMCGLCLPIP